MRSRVRNLVSDQLNYYRARAAEYDEWWLREGPYDLGPEANEIWRAETGALDGVLEAFQPKGKVLELAAGTGIWSKKLLPYASALTLVDGSQEMLAINRSRLRSDKVQYIEADIFNWWPKQKFDTVFFAFWLSHVPAEYFRDFWGMVRSALSPEGRVLFVDSFTDSTSSATVHELRSRGAKMTRRLRDGREFSICKIFYEPDKLKNALEAIGWRIELHKTERYFIYGYGAPDDA